MVACGLSAEVIAWGGGACGIGIGGGDGCSSFEGCLKLYLLRGEDMVADDLQVGGNSEGCRYLYGELTAGQESLEGGGGAHAAYGETGIAIEGGYAGVGDG